MAARYVITRRPMYCRHCAWILEAEDEKGERELLGLFEYRKAIKRVAAELANLAPVVDDTDAAKREARAAERRARTPRKQQSFVWA